MLQNDQNSEKLQDGKYIAEKSNKLNLQHIHYWKDKKKKKGFKCNSAIIVSNGCCKGILDSHLVRF